MAGKDVVDADEWLAKLRAVLAARTHLHVTARTDARAVHGLDDAIDRAKMAIALGVDAVFVEAPSSIAELERIGAELSGRGATLVANMVEGGTTPLCSAAELADAGFGLVINPLTSLLSIIPAMRDGLAELHTNGTVRDRLDHLATFEDITTVVGLDTHVAHAVPEPSEQKGTVR